MDKGQKGPGWCVLQSVNGCSFVEWWWLFVSVVTIRLVYGCFSLVAAVCLLVCCLLACSRIGCDWQTC